jgi:hypothetical protein
MCAVDHNAVGQAALGRKVGDDSVEDAHARPANEPVVERLVVAIGRGRIPPSQTIPYYMDYPADHTPVVHARNATHPREEEFNALKLSLSQPKLIRHRQVLLPRLITMSHQMEFEFAKVCHADKTGHGTGSSSISVSLPCQLASPAADDFRQ